jgi:hypothetical protein
MKTLFLLIIFAGMFNTMSAQNRPQSYLVDDSEIGTSTTNTNKFIYSGTGWVHANNTADPYYMSTASYSNQTGDYVTLNFVGSTIFYYTPRAPHHGIVAISIDNGPEKNVDLYSPTRENEAMVFLANLTYGNHTLKIRVTGTKNPASSNRYVILDRISIMYPLNAHQTAFGFLALINPTILAYNNTAYGAFALNANTDGGHNTGVGYGALKKNTTGSSNVAIGHESLAANITGSANTAGGVYALPANTTGSANTAFGGLVMSANTTGEANTAVGFQALEFNVNGNSNTALGNEALRINISGLNNTAVGRGALARNETGNVNTAVGFQAGPQIGNIQNSTAIGHNAIVTGSNQVRIGDANVTSIGGQVSWSTLSDGRFKKDVREDVSGLDFISKLRPVSYTVDKDAVSKFLRVPDSLRNSPDESRKKGIRQSGFVAQEVEEVIKKTGYVFHGVEVPQSENEHYSIRYAEFVVPLVKAVQELNTLLKEQSVQHAAEIAELKEQLKSYEGAGKSLSETETSLYQNNPNPFTTDTEIKMSLPESTVSAMVIVYNMEGRQLKELSVKGRGETTVKISASELHAGMYLYALIVDGKVVDTKRMILTK